MKITYLAQSVLMLLLLVGCSGTAVSPTPTSLPATPMPTIAPTLTSTATRIPSTTTPTPLPTATPVETSMEDWVIKDFDVVHAPVKGDTNEYLIFGKVPISTPAPDLAPELAAFLGRWEGYSDGPPVKKDWKFVLVIQEITAQDGKVVAWVGTNLQYPTWIKETHFRVVPGATPSIEWDYNIDGASTFTFSYDQTAGLLRGWLKAAAYNNYPWGPIDLKHDQSFTVYKDYTQYLADKQIYPKEYRTPALRSYGQGYLLYLPEGYATNPDKKWPLLIFLHGSGDRGDNLSLLAKASPFMMIREKGPLPCIIVAPILNTSPDYASFPEAYMDGMLKEVLKDYRVDQKRLYLTGLSMGGEAAYRFALHQPQTFAAIAPLAAFDARFYPIAAQQGFTPSTEPLEQIKDLPVWAIHGADDQVVPLSAAQNTVAALKQAGVDVRFSILKDHDHDVWTDTYSDPQFYDWLFQQQRP
jgi:predicted esterase